MSASAPDPNRGTHSAGESAPADAGANQRPSRPAYALLENVLRETANASAQDTDVSPGDLAAVAEVVERYRGQAFCCVPIGVELVQAVLSEQFRPLIVSQSAWEKMSREIAQTLCDDPVSQERVAQLWARLSQEAQ